MTRLRSNPWAVLVVLCMGFFMILLDTTIVNIAIPSIVDALNSSLEGVLWVLNAYILVYAVLLITSGRLGDLYGQRNLFVLGMAIFIVSSAFAGQAQDTNQLIAARAIQGIGGALLTPQTLAILTSIFPPERRGAAFGTWGAVGGIAAIVGPTLGGFIITNLNWRWIFYVNLPIGIFALTATFLIVPDLRPGRRHRLDLMGIALATLGLLCIVYGLIEGERYSWGAVWGWITIPEIIIFGLFVIVVFLIWEHFQDEPLVSLSLFKDRNYMLMNIVGPTMSFAMLGMFLPLTIYLQSGLGLSPLNAGLTIAPSSAAAFLVAPWSGRLADKIGGKFILLTGLLLYAGGMGAAAWSATSQSTWLTFLVPLTIAGFGQGCIMAPMTTVAMRHINPRMAGAASGVLNTTRQLGQVLGSTVVGAVLQNQLTTSLHNQAVIYSAQVPAQLRDLFINAFNSTASGGLEIGRTQQGGAQIPDGVSPQTAEQLQQLFHTVFVNGFVDAMHSTLVVPVVMLVFGASICLAIESNAKAAERAAAMGSHRDAHTPELRTLTDEQPCVD